MDVKTYRIIPPFMGIDIDILEKIADKVESDVIDRISTTMNDIAVVFNR